MEPTITKQGALPGQPAYIKRAEVAAILGVSRRTVDTLCAQGLPHVLLGARCARFNPTEVLAWCQRERGVRRRGTASKSRKGGAA